MAVAAGALVAAGCGGGEDDEPDEVREAAERYIEAVREADGEAFCQVLVRGAVEEIEGPTDRPCAELVTEEMAEDEWAREEAQDLEVSEVNVEGDVATATLAGGPRGEVTQQYVREGGEWKLTLAGD